MKLFEHIEKTIDTINRQGYEWFMHFLLNPGALYDEYKMRYQKYPGFRLLGSVLWRLPLMIFPILPAVYVVTRLVGVILNPVAWYKNFTKPLYMLIGLAVAAGAAFQPIRTYILKPGLTESADFITGALHLGVSTAMKTPVALGLLVMAGTVLVAGIFYAAKQLARWTNYNLTGSSTRKHLIDDPDNALPENLLVVHQKVRQYHQWLKDTLKNQPNDLRFDQDKPWISDREMDNPVEAAEETIQSGKILLKSIEEIMEDQKQLLPISEERAKNCVVDSLGKINLLRQWEASINSVKLAPIELPDFHLIYDSVDSKITERKLNF